MNKFKYTVKTPILTASGEIEAKTPYEARKQLVDYFGSTEVSIEIIKPEVKKWLAVYDIGYGERTHHVEAIDYNSAFKICEEMAQRAFDDSKAIFVYHDKGG